MIRLGLVLVLNMCETKDKNKERTKTHHVLFFFPLLCLRVIFEFGDCFVFGSCFKLSNFSSIQFFTLLTRLVSKYHFFRAYTLVESTVVSTRNSNPKNCDDDLQHVVPARVPVLNSKINVRTPEKNEKRKNNSSISH